MTAAELACEVLDRRKIRVKDKDYWNCWEVSDKEEMGEEDWRTEGDGSRTDVVWELTCKNILKKSQQQTKTEVVVHSTCSTGHKDHSQPCGCVPWVLVTLVRRSYISLPT